MSFDKDTIYCVMVPQPGSDMYRYNLECVGCPRKCTLTFNAPKGPLFAFVGKSAGVFSSLCKRLDAAEADSARRAGQRSLISDASEE